MNKSAIKNFAIEARKILIKSAVTEAGMYGISIDSIAKPIQSTSEMEIYENLAGTETRIYGESIKQRRSLVSAIEEKGFENVMEEVAYTWFNRLIAIRFMEVNDYLPTRVRVLSSETPGKREPDLVTNFMDVAADLNISAEELEQIQKAKDNNNYDEVFRMLFIKQCNALNEILPGLFEKTDDYMELLLKLSYTGESLIRDLLESIDECYFNVEQEGQVEIIGWLYQYYNTDKFNLVYDGNMSRKKVEKEYLPAATQLFTPDWVVKQMNQNTIIPIIYNEINKNEYEYYIENSNNKIIEKLSDVKVIDPAMGSGHFLVNAFDLLMDAYKNIGYNERQAAVEILNKNLYGIDIDKRAYQIAYFSLYMKARRYNRRIFNEPIDVNICCLSTMTYDFKKAITETKLLDEIGKNLCMNLYCYYEHIDEIGTIIKKSDISCMEIIGVINSLEKSEVDNILEYANKELILRELKIILKQHRILNQRYNAVTTNPPYLGSARMSPILLKYVTENYEDAKADLSMAFYDKSYRDLLEDDGYIAFLTTTSWMYLSTYEDFRKNMINTMTFSLLVEFGTELFEGKIGHLPIVSWVCKKNNEKSMMKAVRLVDYCYKNRDLKYKEYFEERNRFSINQEKFKDLPSYPIAYWLDEQFFDFMENKEYLLDQIVTKKAGIVTGKDSYFVRYWFEVSKDDIDFYAKEFKQDTAKKYNIIAKGGSSRQYYGNLEYVVKLRDLWNPDKTNVSVRRGDPQFYLKDAIGWSQIGNTQKTFRVVENAVCGTATPTVYLNDDKYYFYVLAYMNSKIARKYLDVFNPTLNLMSTDICNLPIRIDENKIEKINSLTQELIELYKADWNESECSWEFEEHIYIKYKKEGNLKIISELVEQERNERYERVIELQEQLDNLFSKICQIDTSKLDNCKDANMRNTGIKKDISELINYFVGCIFGRYSIDKKGLQYAGGENKSLPENIIFDKDGVIPITDESYFEDDIVGLIEQYIKIAFGSEHYNDNLDFIINTLELKGNNSREALRSYFLKDFYKNCCQLYQKNPIYWLFDSGKENSFKALIYMHRYDKDTVARVRTDYLHKTQSALENALKNAEYILNTTTSATDRAKAKKAQDKYMKQLAETRVYDQALAYVANQRIEIDLDDGVKHNYELFQNIEISGEGSKKQTVNLLAKI